MKRKQVVITAVFFAISLSSAFLLAMSTLNYIEFYRAISKLTLQLLKVSPSIETEKVELLLIFSIRNPTGYIGLRLREFSYVLYFETYNAQIDLHWDTVSFAEKPLIVDRYWNQTFEYKIDLNPKREQTVYFIDIYKSQPENLTWIMKATSILIAFVGIIDVPLTGRLASNL